MNRGDRILGINEVQPGILVFHRYVHEFGIVLRVCWNEVEVLLENSTVVRWEMDGFRSIYRMIQ